MIRNAHNGSGLQAQAEAPSGKHRAAPALVAVKLDVLAAINQRPDGDGVRPALGIAHG